MGYKVKNLQILTQTGDNPREVYAQWNFTPGASSTSSPSTPTSSNTKIKVGSWVKIKSTATSWYNGASIPASIKPQTWYVTYVSGDRAVLGKNKAGTQNIQSPIKVSNLTLEGSSSTNSSTQNATNLTKTEEILSHLENFKVYWYYYVPGNGWFLDQSTTRDKTKDSSGTWKVTYTAKEEATKIKITVKPVSKKHKVKVGKKEVEKDWWTGENVTKEHKIIITEPPQLSSPKVEIDKCKITATIELSNNEENARVTDVQFQIHDGKGNVTSTSDKKTIVPVKALMATFKYTVPAGGTYRVRCRGINDNGKVVDYGDWSDYASGVSSSPTATQFVDIHGTSSTSVRAEWKPVSGADHYQVEYTTDTKYFNNSTVPQKYDTNDTEVPTTPSGHIEGLETGKKYFFRVRALKGDEVSGWSSVKSVIIGSKPDAPTTWSLSNTVLEGENVFLYWIHNTVDGSKQTQAEIWFKWNNSTPQIETFVNAPRDDEDDRKDPVTVGSYEIVTPPIISGGSTLTWKIRTAGVYENQNGEKIFGPWSDPKTITVLDRPRLTLGVYDSSENQINEISPSFDSIVSILTGSPYYQGDAVIDRYPFIIKARLTANKQRATSYNLKVIADDGYWTIDMNGKTSWIEKGDVIFDKTYVSNANEFSKIFTPADFDMEPNINYIVKCIASTNQGLSVDASVAIVAEFIDTEDMFPDADVYIEDSNYSAFISPTCLDINDKLSGSCKLSVYRRQYDGSFMLIEDDIDNTGRYIVIDPHPALDYARYRIVAQNSKTGEMSFYDIPDTPIECPYAIIQWDESWSSFEVNEHGRSNVYRESVISKVVLKYNLDVSEANEKDVSLIEYIGRESPVSYYGTQKGENQSWSVVIPKDDTETLYALRKLARWMGNVYIREPSGAGYWASVSVSFNKNHNEVTIPVSISITKVEGGA